VRCYVSFLVLGVRALEGIIGEQAMDPIARMKNLGRDPVGYLRGYLMEYGLDVFGII
jgi:hypothetical protein